MNGLTEEQLLGLSPDARDNYRRSNQMHDAINAVHLLRVMREQSIGVLGQRPPWWRWRARRFWDWRRKITGEHYQALGRDLIAKYSLYLDVSPTRIAMFLEHLA